MDRATALQLAADELEDRGIKTSKIDVIDYHPSDPKNGVLAPVGSVTVFIAPAESSLLREVRECAQSKNGQDAKLSQRIRKLFRGREKMSYYQAYQLLRSSDTFATIRYGGKTLATNIFPPPGPDLVVLENPYNGGELSPRELTLVEHFRDHAEARLSAVALRHPPELTKAERAAIESVPADQFEMNLGIRASCCDNWTDYAQVVIAATFAMLCMEPPLPDRVEIDPKVIKRLGPAASARKLLQLRREALGHDH